MGEDTPLPDAPPQELDVARLTAGMAHGEAAAIESFYRACFAGSHDWVSKDRFPHNRNPARRQRQLVEEALGAGRSVVIDNTNPTPQERAEPIALARSLGARVVGYYFESHLAECLERNRNRVGKARVPDVALYATAKRLQPPSYAEGFDQLYRARMAGEGGWEVTGCDDAGSGGGSG